MTRAKEAGRGEKNKEASVLSSPVQVSQSPTANAQANGTSKGAGEQLEPKWSTDMGNDFVNVFS